MHDRTGGGLEAENRFDVIEEVVRQAMGMPAGQEGGEGATHRVWPFAKSLDDAPHA